MTRRNQPVKRDSRKTPPTIDVAEEGDIPLRAQLSSDQGSYQSSHGATGLGGDDERADPDDAKVKGDSRG